MRIGSSNDPALSKVSPSWLGGGGGGVEAARRQPENSGCQQPTETLRLDSVTSNTSPARGGFSGIIGGDCGAPIPHTQHLWWHNDAS